MVDFLKDLLRDFEERSRNPLIVAFLVSFCAFNWKALLVLFDGGQTSLQKISVIDHIGFHFCGPITVAIGYMVLSHPVACLVVLIQQKPRVWPRKQIVEAEAAIREERLRKDISYEKEKRKLLALREENAGTEDAAIAQIMTDFGIGYDAADALFRNSIRTRPALRDADLNLLKTLEGDIPQIWTIAAGLGNTMAKQQITEEKLQQYEDAEEFEQLTNAARSMGTDVNTAEALVSRGIATGEQLRQMSLEEIEACRSIIPEILELAAAKGNEAAREKQLREKGERFRGPTDSPFKLKFVSEPRALTSHGNNATYGFKLAVTNVTAKLHTITKIKATCLANTREEIFWYESPNRELPPNGGAVEFDLKTGLISGFFQSPMQVQSVEVHTLQDDAPLCFQSLE